MSIIVERRMKKQIVETLSLCPDDERMELGKTVTCRLDRRHWVYGDWVMARMAPGQRNVYYVRLE